MLGSTEPRPAPVSALGIDHVIITIADAPPASLRRILKISEGIPVKAQRIPAVDDLLQGKVSISELRVLLSTSMKRRGILPKLAPQQNLWVTVGEVRLG